MLKGNFITFHKQKVALWIVAQHTNSLVDHLRKGGLVDHTGQIAIQVELHVSLIEQTCTSGLKNHGLTYYDETLTAISLFTTLLSQPIITSLLKIRQFVNLLSVS